MKKFARILALALAMMLALSYAFAEQTADATQAPDAAETQAPAEETAEDENPVLFSFDGKEFRKDEVDVVIQNLLNGGYISSAKDYATAVEYMIQNAVIEDEIAQQGMDQFTEEELAAFQTEAQTQWDSALDYYVS